MVEQRDIVRAILELSKQAHSSDESRAKTSTLPCSYHSSTQEPTLSTSNNPYTLKYSGHGAKTAASIKQAVGVAETTPERPRIGNRIAQRHFRMVPERLGVKNKRRGLEIVP